MEPPAAAAEAQQAVVGQPRDIFADDAHSSDDDFCSDAPDFSFDNWSLLPGPVAGSNNDRGLLEVASTGGQQHNEEEQQAVVEQPRVVDGVAQSSNDASHSDVDLDFDFDEVLSELLAGEEQQAVADSGDVADQAADSSPVKRRRQSANDTVGVTRLIYEAMTTKVPLKSMDAHFGGKRRAAVRKLTLMARHYAQPTESSSREAETRRFTFEGLVELGLTVQEARDLIRLAGALGRGMLREGHTANVQKKHLKKYVWTHSRPSASVHDMKAGIVAHEAA